MNLLQKLLSIPSQSGQESEIQHFIFEYLASLKLKPFVVNNNVLVHLAGQDTTKALIFNAHVDTVAVGDASSWDGDPFKGYVKDGRVYGLGASDEKSTVAVLLLLAKNLMNKTPACDVWLHFVTNEEVSGQGTKDCLEWFVRSTKYAQVAGVLGEPTNLSSVEIAHRGNAFVKITTTGDSGHASDPTKIKKHAVFEMINYMKQVEDLANKWKSEYVDPILGEPTVGLYTSISAGDSQSPNKFPTSCSVTIDVRTTPELHKKVLPDLRKLAKGVKVEYAYSPLPCGYTQPDEHIVKVVQKVSGANLAMSSWSNDLCFFTEYHIPAVVYGPGIKEKIHNSNEYCLLKNLGICLRQYEKIIEGFSK